MNTAPQEPAELKQLKAARKKVAFGALLNIFAFSLWVVIALEASSQHSKDDKAYFWLGLIVILCIVGSLIALLTSFVYSLIGVIKITKILNYNGFNRLITCAAQVTPLVQLYTIFLFRNQESNNNSIFERDILEYIQELKDRPIEEYAEPVDIATLEYEYNQWLNKPHTTIEYESYFPLWKKLAIGFISILYICLFITGWIPIGVMLMAFVAGYGGWQFSKVHIETNLRANMIVMTVFYGFLAFSSASARCGVDFSNPLWLRIFLTMIAATLFPWFTGSVLQRIGAKIKIKEHTSL